MECIFLIPRRDYYHHRVADGYVDDVTGFCNTFQGRSGWKIGSTTLADLMKMDAELWNSLLDTLGRCSRTHKMLLVCNGSGCNGSLASKDLLSEKGIAISLNNDNGQSTPVTLRDATEPHTTLGCVKAPNGDQIFQATALYKKSKDIAKQLASTILSREEAFIACQAIITPSLSYPLGNILAF